MPTFSLPVTLVANTNENVNDLNTDLNAITVALNTLDESNVANLAAAFTTWKTIAWAGAAFNPALIPGAGTYLLWGGPPANAGTQNSPGAAGAAASALASFYLDPADWAANARTTKLRIRAQLVTNAVTPAATFTVGLYPVTAFGGASGANPTVSSVGTVVSGSTAVFTTPALSTNTVVLSSEFTAPAAGSFVVAVAVTATPNANANQAVWGHLEMRQV